MDRNTEQLQDQTGQFPILPAGKFTYTKKVLLTIIPLLSTHLIWPPLSVDLRSAVALWTWQIAYWSADVVTNVSSARAAAAAARATQPVLSSVDLQLSPRLPPPSPSTPPHLPVALSWAPCLSGHPPHPSLSLPVLQGVERVTDKHHLLRQAESGRWGQLWGMWPDTGQLWHAWPTKKQGQKKIQKKKQPPAQHSDKSRVGKWIGTGEKKSNLHCFNPQGRLHSHGALTQQLVRKRSCKLTPRPSCILVLQSIHMSLPHMSVIQRGEVFNKPFSSNIQLCAYQHF